MNDIFKNKRYGSDIFKMICYTIVKPSLYMNSTVAPLQM